MVSYSNIKDFSRFLVLALFLIIVSSFMVNADTRLSVNISERVFQNVTYGKDYVYSNVQETCNIMGNMNISNPSDVTVFDVYIKFINIDQMTTDFYNTAGRAGAVIYGGPALQEVLEDDVNITDTVNNYTLSLDLDNDGSTDYMWVNSTDIVFNLSTDGMINLTLRNGGANAPIDAGNIPQTLSMVEVPIVGPSRTYGNFTLTGTTNIADSLYGNETNITINEYEQSPIIIHVPELMPSNYSIFDYNMSCLGTSPPVEIITEYSNDDHPDVNYKVLSGYNWTINQTVINNNDLALNNINISLQPQATTWNDSRVFRFDFAGLFNLGDSANVDTTDSNNWFWVPDGTGTLASGENKSIRYNMTAPFSVPFSDTYFALLENITYSVSYRLTHLPVDQINASADLDFDFDKRIIRPASNVNDHNVTWEIQPYIYSEQNITYDLYKVTLWVSSTMSPLNYTGLNKTYNNTPLSTPIQTVNLTTDWDPSTDYWYFNYTDGSSASYPPPIVWMEPEWLIAHKHGQIMNYSTTRSGNDLYLKYIYVVSGYWLKIEKNITNFGEGQYRINTTVTNIGNGWTPKFERVTVYDFVPNEFSPSGFTDSSYVTEAVGSEGSAYYGSAYKWDIPWKGTMNSSLGPSRGPNTTGYSNYTWNVVYNVTGSGQYKATELYIVGLDPLKVDGAFASPIITIISGIQSYTHEIIYIGVIVFLIMLNITNLVMTNRINNKLSQKMPPPPPPASLNHHGHHQSHPQMQQHSQKSDDHNQFNF